MQRAKTAQAVSTQYAFQNKAVENVGYRGLSDKVVSLCQPNAASVLLLGIFENTLNQIRVLVTQGELIVLHESAAQGGSLPAGDRVVARLLLGYPVQTDPALLPGGELVEVDSVLEQQLVLILIFDEKVRNFFIRHPLLADAAPGKARGNMPYNIYFCKSKWICKPRLPRG